RAVQNQRTVRCHHDSSRVAGINLDKIPAEFTTGSLASEVLNLSLLALRCRQPMGRELSPSAKAMLIQRFGFTKNLLSFKIRLVKFFTIGQVFAAFGQESI